jgi:hypothetical protein
MESARMLKIKKIVTSLSRARRSEDQPDFHRLLHGPTRFPVPQNRGTLGQPFRPRTGFTARPGGRNQNGLLRVLRPRQSLNTETTEGLSEFRVKLFLTISLAYFTEFTPRRRPVSGGLGPPKNALAKPKRLLGINHLAADAKKDQTQKSFRISKATCSAKPKLNELRANSFTAKSLRGCLRKIPNPKALSNQQNGLHEWQNPNPKSVSAGLSGLQPVRYKDTSCPHEAGLITALKIRVRAPEKRMVYLCSLCIHRSVDRITQLGGFPLNSQRAHGNSLRNCCGLSARSRGNRSSARRESRTLLVTVISAPPASSPLHASFRHTLVVLPCGLPLTSAQIIPKGIRKALTTQLNADKIQDCAQCALIGDVGGQQEAKNLDLRGESL